MPISAPDDALEIEAARVEAAFDNRPRPAQVRRASSASGGTVGVAPQIVHSVLSSPGQPLPAPVRASVEPFFGQNFDHVRVHVGSEAARSARAVNARAYTVGDQIVFGAGEYTPESSAGLRLLAHELVHVSQHRNWEVAARRAANRSALLRQDDPERTDETPTDLPSTTPTEINTQQAEEAGRDALATLGYAEIIRLALDAGLLKEGPGSEEPVPEAGPLQRSALGTASVLYRQGVETFGAVFTRYAIAAGITSQLDSPAPGPADVVAVGILVVGLFAAGYAVLSRPACPPCPPNPPPEIDRVPPSTPHYPCTGDHWHYRVYNQNPTTCQCFLSGRQFGGCCGTAGAPC